MMSFKSILKAALCISVLTGATLTGIPNVAQADTRVKVSNLALSSDEIQLDNFLQKYSVSQVQRTGLIQKYRNNQPWDSMSGKGVSSVSNTHIDGQMVSVQRFQDGSVVASAVDDAKVSSRAGVSTTGTVSPMSGTVSGCVELSSTHYSASFTNCHASVDYGVIQLGFLFDRYTLWGGQGSITRAYAGEDRCIGCSLTNFRFTKISDSQRRYSAKFAVAYKDFPMGWTAWMQVNQGIGTQISVTNN